MRYFTSSGVLNTEKLTLTVPVFKVPRASWAKGAQCSPALTAIPLDESSAETCSDGMPFILKLTTGAVEVTVGFSP